MLRRREYAWRSPRAVVLANRDGPLDAFFADLGRRWEGAQAAVQRWFGRLARWLRERRSRDETTPPDAGFSGPDAATLRLLVIALITGLVAALGWLTWRQWRRRPSGAEGRPAPAPGGPVPDLTDDSVLASQLPEDEWLALARRLVGDGDRRLALRAFYLSTLAGLGERGLLAIARHKSNRDYVLELRRRDRGRADEAPGAFARNVARFERVWYGRHDADDRLLADFQADRRIVLG